VHVFQGKVELHDPGDREKAPPHTAVTTGQGVRLDAPGDVQPIKPDPSAFQTAQDLARRSEDVIRRRQLAWMTASKALRQDPSLLVYYPFQAGEPWERTLSDEARGRAQPRDGTIIGGAWVAGRWPGKQGLEFKRVSDRVRLYVPGEFKSITLAAWVRIEGLPNQNNSLFMSDGWDPGELHWQIGKDGTLILGVQSNPRRGWSYHAVEAFTPDRYGQWVHLAVVYDRDAEQVTHYMDGQPVSQVPLQFDVPLRVGDAELGNWNLAMHRNSHPVRYLSGCMDEFLMCSRALSDEEIERLYTQGQPPF
jgi:Concanavalin A-like lectin/glucanases superfamily